MELPLPSTFHSQLSGDRLETISTWLIEEWYATEEDLVRDTDNNYTRGCTTFMRQRVRIMKEAQGGKYSWLGMSSTGNDLVFTIDGIPCRYSNDDATNPSKDAVTTANRHQASFLDFDNVVGPTRFCFVIDRGVEGIGDPHVEFLGYTAAGTLTTRWVSSTVRVFQTVGDQPLVQAVPVDKPVVAPKRRDVDAANDGNVARRQS
ncbi:hypothetical protein DFR24_4452 [Panacagrimonas perspica]|uniref:Uncharacterized protein n=1 Tax=Panacagrimonas perspica TaxID=381431 RepID=A0A4R7NTE4_9GAMM|nr:hypothetical protein [Panacagrimonas perspica]TDU24188.1 hypothetical protein DFR24_4452 [Panacagrimonas perspica]THD04599.1 hypothetical protein B1810_04055 [Panacagrimonas perspica]